MQNAYTDYELGRAVAQAVSRRPLIAEAQVCTRVSSCRFCGEQIVTGKGSSRVIRFPLSVSFHRGNLLGTNDMPVGNLSSKTWSHPIHEQQKLIMNKRL
jgi:hypothetical protein